MSGLPPGLATQVCPVAHCSEPSQAKVCFPPFHLRLLRPAVHRKGGTPGLTVLKDLHRKDQENASKGELLGVEDCQQDLNREANTPDECIKTNADPPAEA